MEREFCAQVKDVCLNTDESSGRGETVSQLPSITRVLWNRRTSTSCSSFEATSRSARTCRCRVSVSGAREQQITATATERSSVVSEQKEEKREEKREEQRASEIGDGDGVGVAKLRSGRLWWTWAAWRTRRRRWTARCRVLELQPLADQRSQLRVRRLQLRLERRDARCSSSTSSTSLRRTRGAQDTGIQHLKSTQSFPQFHISLLDVHVSVITRATKKRFLTIVR